MEPEARQVITDSLHKNYIDHAEYRTAEISKRCVRMIHDLFNGPEGQDAPGTACAGSSEAVMLGALSMKWNWKNRQRRPARTRPGPTLVYGSDVHVVWDKFCCYFDVEPRNIPFRKGKTVIGADDFREPSTRTRSG